MTWGQALPGLPPEPATATRASSPARWPGSSSPRRCCSRWVSGSAPATPAPLAQPIPAGRTRLPEGWFADPAGSWCWCCWWGRRGHLWHRWRVDPGAAAGRQRPAGGHCRPGRAGLDLCDLDRGCRHLRAVVVDAQREHRPELAARAGLWLGGYVGAWLQPWLPERALRRLLGLLAIGLASLYLIQATR
jgi:hypothetical protein